MRRNIYYEISHKYKVTAGATKTNNVKVVSKLDSDEDGWSV